MLLQWKKRSSETNTYASEKEVGAGDQDEEVDGGGAHGGGC